MNYKSNMFSDFYISIIFSFITIQTVNADVIGEDNHHEMGNVEKSVIYGHPGDSTAVDRIVEITAIDIAFNPTLITIKHGENIKFIVKNDGKLLHELALGTKEEQAIHSEKMSELSSVEIAEHMKNEENGIIIQPGETREIIWTFSTNLDQIQYACNLPGHYEAGMFGSINIISDNYRQQIEIR